MTIRTARLGVLFLIALIGLRSASAEEPARAKSVAFGDVEGHLTLARQLFQDEKYSEAADEMLSAYAIEAKPLYLFNAAQAYRKAQRYKDALDKYKMFVDVVVSGPLANEAQGHIQDMEALLKEQDHRQEVRLLLETEQAEKKKTQEQLESEQKKADQMEQALNKERQKPFYKKTWFHGIMGATASVVVVGVLIGVALAGASQTDGGTRSITFSGP